ncbi:hypothetical protein K227x_63940 [Rubripirellula lacrimiformis]|uniref:Uncharacterized protein n=1 Tax=Rubripirellula lacrimiformis TaxID=1930273 RepID=A0A517NLF2_9BACT|nr:hypothetical protein [Rubripirellula lacrimiformis]QDT07964.1 hypothetical protein K227x_63940 [Rubripirellula lacrimiformis]
MVRHGDGIETCLICGDEVRTRGLCTKHYAQFNRRKRSMTRQQAEAFEEKLIADDLLAPSKQPGRPAADDPFADVAEAIMSRYPITTASKMPAAKDSDSDEADFDRQIEAAKAKDEAAKPAKKTTKRKKSG